MARLAFLVLLASDAVAAVHAWTLSSTLPPTVASHFNAAGHPNGWMPRATFVAVYAGVVALLTVIFAIANVAMRVPGARINLPNREHWLAAERRDSTLAWISAWSYWMGSLIVWLLIGVMRLAARANGIEPNAMVGATPLLIAFGAGTVLMLAVMFSHFRNPTA